MIYEIWLALSLMLVFFATRLAALHFGLRWGLAAFIGVVLLSAFAANMIGLELDGAGCADYGYAANEC